MHPQLQAVADEFVTAQARLHSAGEKLSEREAKVLATLSHDQLPRYLDHFEGLYQETFGWVLKAPVAEIAKNELSKAPELRLYTYVPEEKKK